MSASISIVIPTYNEVDGIQGLVRYLLTSGNRPAPEIIVADGGSSDNTPELARAAGAKVIRSPQKGRAAQMNAGAAFATGEILYFLHADTFPPADFQTAILESCASGAGAGCFRLRFDDSHWFLKVNAWFTRFDLDHIRFGDQSLFILKSAFERIGGFREDHIVMEDQEIIYRIKEVTRFNVLPAAVVTSAQKYRQNGIYRLQFIFSVIWLLYYIRVPQQKLVSIYNRLIKKSKLK
ncbi:TIGR04283 family arsenosugar biosynthesis glycosyltransferase [Pontibacter sp. FD36]|uniref:TIGR04283 family arsenosugar biosynthesis glycosyltransferase n=1 Tax=Pontibacter sp. FD36 TaxID=2789860 RepID=UPI0018AB3F0C|nr:TIGR04283 family arsenosugar biosynthesis glycosyltransferase [Pontibacter sp. FD36]MBF8965524.1 TIGR04283 family arsenosugar biosynthesis glycosyltransferase [Pontibacter sp. FD36]